jgi:hypothetical protein
MIIGKDLKKERCFNRHSKIVMNYINSYFKYKIIIVYYAIDCYKNKINNQNLMHILLQIIILISFSNNFPNS